MAHGFEHDSMRARGAARGVALACCLLVAGAVAAAPVLPPAAGPFLERALGSLSAEWSFPSISVGGEQATVQACGEGGGACVTVLLTAASASCKGRVAGDWCVSVPDSANATLDGAVVEALGAATEPSPWASPREEVPRDWLRIAAVAAMAVGELVLPLGLGLLAGWWARSRSRRLRWGLAAVPLVIPLVVPPAWSGIGVWDTLLLAASFGVGVAATAGVAGWRLVGARVLVCAAACLLGALGVEVGARWLADAPVVFPRTEYVHWWLPPATGLAPDAAIEPAWLLDRRLESVRPGRPLVLHVGDSLTEGRPEPGNSFPDVLDALDPDHDHVNGGVVGAGPDAYRLLLEAFLVRVTPALAVVHYFPGNDFMDLDAPSPCCGDEPLLRYVGGRSQPRCTACRASPSRSWHLPESPPPFVLRALTEVSTAARLFCVAFHQLSAIGLPAPPTEAERLQHLECIVSDMARMARERRVSLVFSILPDKWELDAVEGHEVSSRRFRERLTQMALSQGVPVFDAHDEFAALARGPGYDEMFVSARDGHFAADANRRYAAWLMERLGPLLATRSGAGAF